MSNIDMECDAYGESSSGYLNENKKSQTLLFSLNFDYLMHVLSHLNLIDLINVASTCKQLRELTEVKFCKFDTFNSSHYKNYVKKTIGPMPIEKILSKMKPYIVSLILEGGFKNNDETFCRAIMKYCTQVKSLRATNSKILKWINLSKLEYLSLWKVKRNDLNKFTYGLTTLKNIHFQNVDDEMSLEEFNFFLVRNPNIESLVFDSATPHQLNFNIFQELTKLKRLSLTFQQRILDLQPLLHIRELTKLTLKFYYIHDFSSIITFFECLAERGTLKKLEIFGMKLSHCALNSLSLLNLDSIRIVPPSRFSLYRELCNALPNLKHLDIMQPIKYVDIIFLIQNLRKLEQIEHISFEKCNNETFLNMVREIIKRPVERPALTICNYIETEAIKIEFNLCRFKIVTQTAKTGDIQDIDSYNPFIY